jgi:hypothetical protein
MRASESLSGERSTVLKEPLRSHRTISKFKTSAQNVSHVEFHHIVAVVEDAKDWDSMSRVKESNTTSFPVLYVVAST